MMEISQQKVDGWLRQHPELKDILALKPVLWHNPKKADAGGLGSLALGLADIEQAENVWRKFAPFLAAEFPEVAVSGGIIESPLLPIPEMKRNLERVYGRPIGGRLLLKSDGDLPIAGSVKARGGIFEVLLHAEGLAKKAGMLHEGDSYDRFSSEEFKKFFSGYSIGVGSTGNLALSIGIISAKLGFDVSVYMSGDAKQWKKDLLRQKGVRVVEFEGDFGIAINAGRKETLAKPDAYFVDDEKSERLFLGYSTAALRLKEQLKEMDIEVNPERPLIVYLPCGVGGAPGGIAFGLRHMFGDAVHCYFVEPTHSPAVLLGLLTGEKSAVSVQDFGIDNITEGDGLAVGRPSGFASDFNEQTVSGLFTIEDDELFRLLALLADSEDIFVEPSATAGLIGPAMLHRFGAPPHFEQATHIAWSTGGSLVPQEERNRFYEKGKALG